MTLAQAGGMAGETGEDVPLNGVVTQSVRLSALSNWSLLGLAERQRPVFTGF